MAVVGRWAAAALFAVSLSACGTAYNTDGFWNDAGFWQSSDSSEAAMAAMSKGDFTRAEALGTQAMHRNPKDPYAILALAVVYENTSRPELAKQYYEVLVSMNPQATALVGVGPTARRRTIAEIAGEHLALLGGGAKRRAAPSGQTNFLDVAPPPDVSALDLGASDDANIIVRFQTLRRLLDEGLIARDEYNRRRGANLGALLPYTAPQPGAADLGRPAPAPEQVVHRLHFLAAAYEEKSISAAEQEAERNGILDALLPARVTKRANPAARLTEPIQAAAVAGRMAKLRAGNVITEREAAREKDAAYRIVAAHQADSEAAARAAAGIMPPSAPESGPGIRLASYRSESAARHAWENLQRRYPSKLHDLQSQITRVSLRRGHVAYRLSAGPLPDRKAAVGLCRSLEHDHVACHVATVGK